MPLFGKQLKSLIMLFALAALTVVAILLALVITKDVVVSVILIALILLLWPIGFLLRHYLKQRAPEAEAQGAEAGGAEQAVQKASPNRPSREHKHLESGAVETVDFLRRHRSAAQGGDAIYSLPWLVIAGPPGSGKSSLMLSGGLSFNALESQRRVDQDLLRPTRDCDWRVTDDAVLIDTAGRYQTEGEDRDEWLGLIEALKKHRKQRPLDGLIVTFNCRSLLALQSSAEVIQQAQLLRARLNELISETKLQFPVYLVFTQADAIPGFAEFFNGLGAEERSQVWGATIPLAQKDRAHALFDTEFDYLLDSLMRRRLLRLGRSGSAREQLGVFDFPLHFNIARQKLGEFTTALFSPNPFSELPLLRGIYFTCSPSGQPPHAEEGQSSEVRIRHKGLFTEDFFKQVLLRDRHVAAALQTESGRSNRTRKLAIAAGALGAICLLLIIGMLSSYFNNRQLIRDGQQAGADLLRHFKPAASGAPLTPVEVEDLGKLQDALMKLDEYDESWFGPLSHRFGLYAGERLKPRLREIYFDFVAQRLLDPALDGLAQELDQVTPAPAADGTQSPETGPEQVYYDKLKAYQMVERQDRVEPVFLQNQLAEHWREGSSAEKRHLAYYAQQAGLSDDEDGSIPRPLASADVVKRWREKLDRYTGEAIIYNQVKSNIEKQGEPYYLRNALSSSQGHQFFEDVNSPSVPYAFTKQAYYKHVKGDALTDIFNELRSKSENDWVLDKPGDYKLIEPRNLLRRYERDYITAWQKFLDGLRVKKFEKRTDAVAALTSFSQSNSPFTKIIDEVKTQITLSEPPASDGALGWLKSWVTPKGRADTEVEKSFAALKTFNVEKYVEKLKELKDVLENARGAEWSQAASLKDDEKFVKAKNGLNESLNLLKTGGLGSAALAELLVSPLSNIEVALGIGVGRNRDAAWASLVGLAQQLEARYPFNSGSGVQVLPKDLADYLNRLKQFSDQHLSASLDLSNCEMRPLGSETFAPEFIIYLKDMCRVRDSLMASGQLGFSYTALIDAPGQMAELRVDGATIKAEGGRGSGTPNWPSSGQENGVKVGIVQNGQFNQVAGYDGPWGIFKMAANRAGGGAQNFNGVRVTLQPPANDPFQLPFTRIRAPRKIQ